MKRLCMALIRFYQRTLSRLKPYPTCRFTPTCSQYALEAVQEHGACKGLLLALWRILRCNPFCKGGYDPVPRRQQGLPGGPTHRRAREPRGKDSK